MKKEIIKYTFADKKDWYDLTYRITEHCSHGCRYCDFYNNKRPTHTKCWKEVGNFIKTELKDQKIRLYIYGGEPTTHPYLIQILEELSPIVDTIGIQTNLFGSLEFFKNILEFDNVFILPTFHVEREKKHKDFLEKVLFIKMKKRLWELNFLLPLKNFKYNYQIFLDFEKILKQDVVPQPLIGEEKEWLEKKILERYLDSKEYEMYRHYSDGTVEGLSMSEWRNQKEDYVTGWHCSAGTDTLYIEWNGDIFQCLNDMYLKAEPLGSIFDSTGYKQNLKRNCPYKHCQFSTHITIWKNYERKN